jgi:DNA-binding HxlR family transcriptional regulator
MNTFKGTKNDCKELYLSMRDFGDIWGGKWKLQIILYLSINKDKTIFFTQMRNDISGISSKMLSKELKDMEMNQLVSRIVHPTMPVNVEYRITTHGESFAPVAKTMILWGVQHRKVILGAFTS